MCPTLLGRLQTRLASWLLPAVVAAVWGLLRGDAAWPAFLGVCLLVGAALDAGVYRPLVRWQPPWLTLAMGAFEWVIVVGLAQWLPFDVHEGTASVVFWSAWLGAQAVRIAVLPVVFVTRLEEGGELGRSRWWIPAGQHALPPGADAAAPLPDRLSAVWSTGDPDVAPLAPPSQIAPIPAEFLAALDAVKPRDDR